MNKKRMLGVLVILVFVLGSAFSIAMPSPAVATLTASIDEYLEHGFTNDLGVKYNATIAIANAFDTDPEFVYGYHSNAAGEFSFIMEVGDFIMDTNSANVVKIAAVTSTNSPSSFAYTANGYTILSNYVATVGVEQLAETTITITPATTIGGYDHTGVYEVLDTETVDTAVAGSYTSTITFTVAAV
jgi:hypothetical protein